MMICNLTETIHEDLSRLFVYTFGVLASEELCWTSIFEASAIEDELKFFVERTTWSVRGFKHDFDAQFLELRHNFIVTTIKISEEHFASLAKNNPFTWE